MAKFKVTYESHKTGRQEIIIEPDAASITEKVIKGESYHPVHFEEVD